MKKTIEPAPRSEKTSSWFGARASALGLVAAAFLAFMATPEPAHAQLATCDACTAPLVGFMDDDVSSAIDGVQNDINMESTEAIPLGSQVVSDSLKYYLGVHQVAGESANSYVSEQSVHCAITYLEQALTTSRTFVDVLARALTVMATRDRNSGQKAASGTGMIAQEICDRAPFMAGSQRYGALAAQLGNCPSNPAAAAPAAYVDADLDPTQVYVKKQYNAPVNMTLSQNTNHLLFQPGSNLEWNWFAAFRYCEHLLPLKPPPPNRQGNLASADLIQAYSDMQNTVHQSPAFGECIHLLAERTACAPGTNFTSGTNGWTCSQIQSAVCHRFKEQPPGGLGIADIGDEEANAALAQCDQNGLSYYVSSFIQARRCGEGNFMSIVVPGVYADTKNVEHEADNCDSKWSNFELIDRAEKTSFNQAVAASRAGDNARGVDQSPVAQPF